MLNRLEDLQDIGLQVQLSWVEGGVDGQVDGILGLSRVVVVDERRVRSDLIAGSEPTNKILLKFWLNENFG